MAAWRNHDGQRFFAAASDIVERRALDTLDDDARIGRTRWKAVGDYRQVKASSAECD